MKFSMELFTCRTCCRPKQCSLLCSILLSFIGLWVLVSELLWVIIRHRNKFARPKSNPGQSCRYKSTTSPRKGRLLRLQTKSASTSVYNAPKLQNNLWHDSELIATKVCTILFLKFWSYCHTYQPVVGLPLLPVRTREPEHFWTYCCHSLYLWRSLMLLYMVTLWNRIKPL